MSKIVVYSGDKIDCTLHKITSKWHKFQTFIQLWHYSRFESNQFDLFQVKATSHSTTLDIPMRPLREDQRSKTPTSFYPLKKARSSRDGNYSFDFCSLYAAHT